MENNGFENSRGLVNAAGQKIAVLTDSCTDVPADIVEKYGIRVVPLHINYKNASYRDRVDIQPDEVYARFQEEIPKTSTPTPAEATRPRLFTMARMTRKEMLTSRSCSAMGVPSTRVRRSSFPWGRILRRLKGKGSPFLRISSRQRKLPKGPAAAQNNSCFGGIGIV